MIVVVPVIFLLIFAFLWLLFNLSGTGLIIFLALLFTPIVIFGIIEAMNDDY